MTPAEKFRDTITFFIGEQRNLDSREIVEILRKVADELEDFDEIINEAESNYEHNQSVKGD